MDNRTFLERINEKWILTPGGCWQWTAYRDRDGYGQITTKGRKQLAHRAMLEAIGKPPPSDMEVDHMCRNRGCVNPLHLDVVTKKVNSLRSMSFAAINALKTRCIHGHEFTPENTRMDNRGRRGCKACNRIHVAASTARRKARTLAPASSVPAPGESGAGR